eukprot:scaffold12220_cov204-Skeletonema_marinoi.AAC.6
MLHLPTLSMKVNLHVILLHHLPQVLQLQINVPLGEVCKGKGSLPCCSLFTCGSEKKCIDASGYGGGSSRMLRFSEPGFLVDD